ncbi:PAS and ANTAR domain-containing protein [soil metagenome]
MRSELAGRFPSARVGSFTMDFATQRFNWSAEVAAIHGYPAEPVEVGAEFVLAHKHPDDLPRVKTLFDELIATKTPLSSRHRIIDAAGNIHNVLVVSKSLLADDDSVVGVQGFYVDISSVFGEQVDDAVDVAVAEFAANRAAIEQAKGMVMLTYNIPADRAFDVLKWRSQQTNTKIRALCELIVKRAVDEISTNDDNRAIFDDILLNAANPRSD